MVQAHVSLIRCLHKDPLWTKNINEEILSRLGKLRDLNSRLSSENPSEEIGKYIHVVWKTWNCRHIIINHLLYCYSSLSPWHACCVCIGALVKEDI